MPMLSEARTTANRVLRADADALLQTADRLTPGYDRVVDLIDDAKGRLCVTGVGKSADIAQKLVGTFNSTGTRSYTLDATRAIHGDLGMIHPDDVVLLLSHSGESDELTRLLYSPPRWWRSPATLKVRWLAASMPPSSTAPSPSPALLRWRRRQVRSS
jgi:DNA-binding MurR/RpiR family transcriptional regulator